MNGPGAAAGLRVLGRDDSINVRKVLWCCEELGLAYAREDWGGGFRATAEPAFLALNPNALVPVLVDGDYVLWESNAILRYLAAGHGGEAIYPAEPRRRGRIEQWLDWQATEFNGAWRYAFMALVRQSPAHQDPAQIAASLARWTQCAGILDRQLAAGGYAAGDRFSLADIALGLAVHRWFAAPIERPHYPALADYYARLDAEHAGFRRHGSGGGP